MTKKDYVLIGTSLFLTYQVVVKGLEYPAYEQLVQRLALRLQADNPKFDMDKFFEITGIKEAV